MGHVADWTVRVSVSAEGDVTKAIAEVAKCYGVQPVEGVLMHQMKRCVALSLWRSRSRSGARARFYVKVTRRVSAAEPTHQ